MDDILVFVGLPVILAVFSYLTFKYFNSGLINKIEITHKESIPLLSQTTTLFFKHQIGSYSSHTSILKELIELLPQGALTIRILYDDDFKCQSRRLQAAIGCIFGEENEDYYTQNFSTQLKRFGYERLVVRPSGNVLHCAVPHNQSFFSRINMSYRVFPALRNVFDSLDNRPDCLIVIEIIDTINNTAHAFIPLENVEEFNDAQHLTSDELDSKIARQKFDSDEESSESEPDFTDNERDFEDNIDEEATN